ncbi:Fcf1-domain-containing protein, partial [Trametopsis cervina]
MRQKRAKTYRKLMSLYSMYFGFRQPYQVLVDSEMCKTAIAQKIELYKQLGVVLQGTVKPMITQCCIHELYLQGKAEQPAVDLAKTFERRKCNHKEAIPGDECLTSVIGETNKHRYVLATQSQPLRSSMRMIPAVPIIHVNRSVMILEPPSDATIRAKNSTEQQSLMPSSSELAQLAPASGAEEPPKKKRKGPKGPNPLSVKKKK